MTLEKLAKTENADNDMEFKRQLGKPVRYGQVIQLKHVITGKYVHASSTDAASLDIMSMAAILSAENSKRNNPVPSSSFCKCALGNNLLLLECFFKTMPRYKVRTEGDTVRFNDQVTFESIKLPGRFLDAGDATFPKGIFLGCYEIDVSTRLCPFTVVPHSTSNELETQAQFIKGGDVICFYHKELDSYLSAEGVFVENEIIEDPHLHERYSSTGTDSKLTATNANFFWQLELEAESLKGEAIAWEVGFKLKHLTTRKYLSCHGGKLSLTPDFSSRQAVFRFHPLEKTGLYIDNGASVILEHAKTATFVHGQGELYDYKQSVPEDKDDPLQSIRWETAITRKCTTVEQSGFDNAFSVYKIDTRNLKNFSMVAGLLPYLQDYAQMMTTTKIAEVDQGDLFVRELFLIITPLVNANSPLVAPFT